MSPGKGRLLFKPSYAILRSAASRSNRSSTTSKDRQGLAEVEQHGIHLCSPFFGVYTRIYVKKMTSQPKNSKDTRRGFSWPPREPRRGRSAGLQSVPGQARARSL